MATENHVNNYYLLKRVAAFLNEQILQYRLVIRHASGRNEITFVYSKSKHRVFMKVVLGDEAFLFFPKTQTRLPDSNTPFADELTGKQLLNVEANYQDRSLTLIFEDNYKMVIALYGRNGNVFLFQREKLVSIFRTAFATHIEKKLSEFGVKELPPQEVLSRKDLMRYFPAITRQMYKKYFVGFDKLMAEGQRECIMEFEKRIERNEIVLAHKENMPNSIVLSLLPSEKEVFLQTQNADEALNEYAGYFFRFKKLNNFKAQQLKSVADKISKAEGKLKSANAHLKQLEDDRNYKHMADIIMANLHNIPHGAEVIELQDFYQNKPVSIKLKRELSPQKWAEKLYGKAKNQEIEREKTLEYILSLEEQITALGEEKKRLEELDSLKDLRGYTQPDGKAKTEEKVLPFRHFKIEGFDVYVGKGAENNDKLSFGFAKKDDLWMHARGVAGSHVVVRHKKNNAFPKSVIEKAASIAAYYSKGKSSGLCPVIYTPKKYVRKPKGAPAGQVVCMREEVVLVEPRLSA